MKLLLAVGAKINQQQNWGWSPLIDAVVGCNLEAVKILLQAKANMEIAESNGTTALMSAVEQLRVSNPEKAENAWKIFELLLAKGANVNAQSQSGKTALMSAAYQANVNALRLLGQYKANPNLRDCYGKTALMNICQEEYQKAEKLVQVIETLLQLGADVS